MARYVTLPKELVATPIIFGKKPCINYSAFGSGRFEYFGTSGTFTIPEGVTNIRVTAVGAGGAGSCARMSSCFCHRAVGGNGGGGGGYVLAEVPVTAGTVCTITVGAFPGGTTCMGTQVIANGGCNATCATAQCNNYNQICGFSSVGCGGNGGTANTSGVTVLFACTGSCGTNGLCGCPSEIRDCFCYLPVPCAQSSCACCISHYMAGRGGAAGSYLGTSGQSEFPGTLGADIFSCKSFNGESVALADVSVPVTKPRWPGEFVVSTSRLDTSIAGTAAGYPCPTYLTSVFGGANSVSCCCEVGIRDFGKAGCGGGGSGGANSYYTRRCCAAYNNQLTFECTCGSSCSAVTCSLGGNGYFVVEY